MPVLPGHSIPYQLTTAEAAEWVYQNGGRRDATGDYTVGAYLVSPQGRPWGIIVPMPYGEILVWVDASGKRHVVDVTNMQVAREIAKKPYESPDESFIQNFLNGLQSSLNSILLLLAIAAAVSIIRK